MTTNEIEILKTQVRKDISELEVSVSTIAELVESDAQSGANDWFTTGEVNPSKEINEFAIEKSRKLILILNEVLSRMDKPDYGICVSCGKSIPFGRMKAVPTSKKCMACT